ncbi:MAG: hypothetical protein JWL95_2719 [Gemmatimonadetes bacterium]|nr:hypothetical protein [Gemmatimonadota bacterium]
MTGPASMTAALLIVLASAASSDVRDAAAQGAKQAGAVSSTTSKAKVRRMSTAEMVRSALSAAPTEVADHAAVIAPDSSGKMVEIHAGTNGWTCMPDAPESPGLDPMCFDTPGMQWAKSWMAKEAKPANTVPGLVYMLQGGSDISAKDPFQTTTEHYVASPPHFMILWPYESEKTGFSTMPKKTGTWIMWAGTPYAHLMINQTP